MNPQSNRTIVLVVLDGWGIAPPGPGNAMSQARLPNMSKLWSSYPHTQIGASGDAVGLPRGEVGNTETGHLNLGAGRIIYQDLARINMSIADGSFFDNPALLSAIEHAKNNNSKLHLMGLVGAGGVHSNIEHLFAMIQLAARQNFRNVFVHAFTDGRDSPPNAGLVYLSQIQEVLRKENVGRVASVMGRYWAMDRDQRWDRTARAYFALTAGKGHLVKTPEEAIELSYTQGVTDEFIEPSIITDVTGKPVGLIEPNDAIVFFNFRIDRPRQLSRALVIKDLKSASSKWSFDPYDIKYQKKHTNAPHPQGYFDRGPALSNLKFVTMTEYEKVLIEEGAIAAFPPEIVSMPLGRVISARGYKQLRVAESEKERFVTFYFNGQRELPFEGEEKMIIASPKVATYDLKPEMSANETTNVLLEKIRTNEYSFALINYANADMVGHTGNIAAAVKAVETIDACLGRLTDFVIGTNSVMIITADHGNAEEMVKIKTGDTDTEHSANPVPFIAVSKDFVGKGIGLPSGILADIAPTILHLMGLEVPSSMMGHNLLGDLR